MKINSISKLALFIIGFSFVTIESFADHSQNGSNGVGHQGPKPPKEIPIDGGLSLLLAAGVGLGARKFLMKQKEENA